MIFAEWHFHAKSLNIKKKNQEISSNMKIKESIKTKFSLLFCSEQTCIHVYFFKTFFQSTCSYYVKYIQSPRRNCLTVFFSFSNEEWSKQQTLKWFLGERDEIMENTI